MRLREFVWQRKFQDEELATFRFYLWSPDQNIDQLIVQELKTYDKKETESDTRSNEYHSEIRNQCAQIVFKYLGEEARIMNFSIRYNRSGQIDFNVIIVGLVSLYVLVSRYDNFRKSLDRIKQDIDHLLDRVLGRQRYYGPVIRESEWSPSRLFIRLENLREQRLYFSDNAITWAFVIYLIISNILLGSALFALVYRAVEKVYLTH